MVTDADTGALGPSGRFARMEAALDRIELKLDLKADAVRVAALEARHESLEKLIADLTSGQMQTPLGLLYMERFKAMEASIEKMEKSDSNREAVMDAAAKSGEDRYRVLSWAVGIGLLLNVGIAVYNAWGPV